MFHWLLAAAVAGLVLSGQIGGNFMDWHGRFGIAVIGLPAFRLVWGWLARPMRGSPSSSRPRQDSAYLRGEWRAWATTPWAPCRFSAFSPSSPWWPPPAFSPTTISPSRPLWSLAGKGHGRSPGRHPPTQPSSSGLVALHIGAIVFYARVKKTTWSGPC